MFENIGSFFKKIMKNETKELVSDTTATNNTSKEAAKERLQLVLMQDRANVSADFLELMKQEIVDVIKKYIVVEEETIDVRIINQENEDGTQGAPSLCANIPILNIRNDNKGEKFRKEQNANITKDIASEVVEQKTSDNDSNDNVKIVNDNIENVVEELNNERESTVVEEIVEEVSNSDVNDKVEESLETSNNDLNQENIEVEDEDAELERLEKIANEALMNTSSNIELDNYDYDEEDDDVTFDDLLKAAEEEEKMQKQAKTSKKSTSSKSKSSKSKSTSKSNKPKKKTNKK